MAKFGPALVALVLAAVLGISSGSWCTKNIIQTYTTTITYINPCPYRGNYISQRRVTRTRLVTIRVCCDGWTGCYCSIPICRNGCGVNQKCVLPNTCECSSRQFVPVAGNTQCSVAFCTTKDNCYPGTCMGSNQCTCSSGFGGPNCQTVLDTARYRKCLVTLEGIDYYGSRASNMIDGECKEENIIIDISLKSAFSKLKRVIRMRLDWEGYYHEPRDIPQYAPYISYSLPGIIYASTNLSNGATFPCFDKKLANNASLAVRCTESQPVNSAMPHNSRLNISLYTLIGGFKEYKAVDGLGTYERQEYTGQPASVVFDVTFDSEPPVHCFVAQQIQCESEDADTPDPEPIFAAIDATTDPKITFYWPGWYDEPSQIKDYVYSIWVLQYVNRSLVPYGPPDQRGLWDPTNDYPSVIVNQPCLISAVLNVTDYAGNTRRADTLVLYAPGSSLEADNSNPIKVLEAPDGGRWLNTLAAPTVSLSYDRHFINKVFEEYKLLAPVYQHPDIDSMYRDNFGNITSVGLGPTEGLKYVNFTSEVIPATTTRKKRQTPQLGSVSPLTGASLTSKLVAVPFNPSSDGDSVKVDLTVVDVMGNVVKETVRVGADSSPPLVDLQTARFEGNTRRKIDGLEHFTSSFIARAFDPHSGVTRAEWKASQPGNQVSGVYNIPPLEGPDCLALGQDCICTPLGDCYNVNAEVLIDNCELAKLDNKVPFDIEITFNNNASLASNSTTRKINPYPIDGPGKYPPVAELFVSSKSPTEVEVKWRLPHACEKFSRIMIEYKQRSTTSQSQTLSSMAVNTTISGLHAQRESTVTITIVYTNGREGKISHNFITAATALAITGGQIAGVVIGLIVFIIILLIVLLLLLMWIYRTKTIEEKPSLLVSFEEKMETYGVLKVYRERIYRESPYYKAQLPNPYAKKVDDGVLYDEVKNYHDMSPPQGSSAKNYDISTIVLGSGSLFIVKRANLKDKAGSKAVAAKMLKEGKGEPGKIVLLAKINYMSRISKHQNLINYISSDKEVPIMFLELCGLGTLLDWVKNVKQPLSTEDNDKLLAFSQDITAGVKHLHDNNFVHRRLAAHNILLASGSDRPIAKITGFGPLSSDYDKQNKKIPARWMAPELLVTPPTGESRPYSTHSDMWSWGITLWELFSLGQKPYEDIPIDQLRRRVIEGERPSQPQYCADTMYEQLMKPCWQLNPNNRASVEHVYTRLDTFVNGSHTNDSYYPEGATHNLDDDCMLENEQNRDRYYSNNNPQQSYFDP